MVKAIPQYIVDGAIEFNTEEAGNALLSQFPGVPELMRMQADILVAKNHPLAAAGLFAESARLHLRAGQILPAVVTKVLEWRLSKPGRETMLEFHGAVEAATHDGSPLNACLQKLAPQERMALFARFERLILPKGKTIETVGDPEKGLMFLISGKVKENRFHVIDRKSNLRREESATLAAGAFFGDLYPLQDAVCSNAVVDTLTRVELAGVSKRRLIQLGFKYPNLCAGLVKIYRERSLSDGQRLSCAARRGERYEVPVRMSLEVPSSGNGRPSLLLDGQIRDLSISGMSFIIEPEGFEAPPDQVVAVPECDGQSVQVKLPLEGMSVMIAGRIVRRRRIIVNGFKTLVLCIEFDEIPPRLRGAFLSMTQWVNGHGGREAARIAAL